ncbi:alpha/beta hydrolase [Hyphomicrobium sp. CS1GBMeth3]|uniref:alpha/beta hydrolase n=1 Tax=Hyphomicrobium sp. CS1GBMeth3 TaxID=1892845 RepID=UPI000930142B|nr:alpha/beta hydrolase [Hyphomicrobium sp. CS1GBMeth3]
MTASPSWQSAAAGLAVAAGLALPFATPASAASKTPAMRDAQTSAVREMQPQAVPKPHEVQSRSAPLAKARTTLVPFQTAPFPYRGTIPTSGKPFLDVEQDGRRGHTTPFGRLYWEDETYSDNRVLLHIPKGFDVRRPSLLLVFFHGHGATLERDVLRRQRVVEQISRSGANVALIAPQFAVDAADSSAGQFWQPGAFGRFMGEAAEELARLHGGPRAIRAFAAAPVIFVAYSGGYLAAASSAMKGGINKRLRGVVLLDALYGEIGKFASWIESDRSAFFVSAYLGSTLQKNAELADILSARAIDYKTELDHPLHQGDIALLAGGENVTHRSFVTEAWVDNPIEDLLRRLPAYRR